jgi:UDP-glucose 4-epimerase
MTGGGGFIGGHLIPALVGCGAEVATASRAATGRSGTQHFSVDLCDPAECQRVVAAARPDVIYHLAAVRERTPDVRALRDAMETNFFATAHVLIAAATVPGLETVVVLGTGEEYGGDHASACTEAMREAPVSIYSLSKVCSTHLAQFMSRVHHVPCVVVRASVVYGPGQADDMFLPALVGAIAGGRPFKMTLGEQTRDFIYITDLIDALVRVSRCKDGQIVNIGSGVATSIAEVARKVGRLLGREHLVQVGALAYRQAEVMNSTIDNALASRLLGWRPRVSLDDGLAWTVQAYVEAASSSA